MKKQFAAFLFISLFFLMSIPSTMAQVQVPSANDIIKNIVTIIFGSDVPADWLTTTGFMQNIFFPFIALFAVMYGLLTELHIFKGQRTTKLVIAIVMSFVSGWWTLSSMRWILAGNAFIATWAFGGVLFLGILFWAGSGLSEGWFGLTGKRLFKGELEKRERMEKRLNSLRAERARLYNLYIKLSTANKIDTAQEVRADLDKVDGQIEEIEGELYEGLKNPEHMA
jgi:hypothetical protein